MKTLQLSVPLLGICLVTHIANAQTAWNAVTNVAPDTNWSTPANWTAGVPTSSSGAIFNDTTGVADTTINNVVDSSSISPISSLLYTNRTTHQNTLIAPGVTLTINGANGLLATNLSGASGIAPITTISGTGAALVINNSSATINAGISGSSGSGPQTLDLSGLDTFTMTGAAMRSGVGQSSSTPRTAGILSLAKTNVITLTGSSPQVIVGQNSQNTGNASTLNLGQTNAIFADSLAVGIDKQGVTSGLISTLQFNSLFTANNPTAYFRGHDGVSPVTSWSIADGLVNTGSSTAPRGTIDFTGGTVNARVSAIWIAKPSASSPTSPSAAGTLAMGAGVINVDNLTNGYTLVSTGTPTATGTVNVTNNGVNGPGTLIVNNELRMASKLGAGNCTGTLNIDGGSTVQANAIVAGGGAANINVNFGTLIVTNTAGTPAAPLATLSLATTGAATLQLSVAGAVAEINTTNLSVNGPVTINIASLPVITSYPKQFPLIGYSSFPGTFNFTLGALPAGTPAFQGYISNNVTGNSIDLVLTSGPLVTALFQWTGAANNNWDLSSVDWKLFGSATTYSNTSLVIFNDNTAVTNVNLTQNLSPGGITMSNNVNSYTFLGSGALVGSGGLNIFGSGTLVMANSGANQFSGDVAINGGALQFGSGGSGGNFPSGDAVMDNGTLIFDLNNSAPVFGVISGSGNVVQNGSGVLSMSASNSYAGPTTVNNGTLIVDGALAGGGLVSSAAGTTLGGNGTIVGAVNAGGRINPGDLNTIGTLTVSNNVTLTPGGSLYFDLSSTDPSISPGVNDLLQISGNLTLNNNIIGINVEGIPTIGNNYGVVTYTGTLSGSFNPTVIGTHYTTAIDTSSSPGFVFVDITGGSGASLKWNSTGSGVWDSGTSNWFNLGTAQSDFYGNGDAVLLDDSVTGAQTNLTIASGVSIAPLSITNTGAFNYSISGGGTITGPTTLYKDGSGTLTINTANSFTGGTAIANGTLVLGTATALGSIALNTVATITVSNAGTLDLGGQTVKNQHAYLSGAGVGSNGAVVNSNPGGGTLEVVTLNGDTTLGGIDDWRIANQTSGHATLNTAGLPVNLTKVGPNQLLLLGCDTTDGNIENVNIAQGSLAIQGSTPQPSSQLGDPNGTMTIYSNANFQASSLTAIITKNILLDDGGILWSAAGSSTIAGSVILTNNAANTAPGTGIVTNNSGSTLVVQSVISGPGNLLKTGTGTTLVEGIDTYTGNTTVNAGTLALDDLGAISNSANVILTSGTVLDVSARTDNTFELAAGQTLSGSGTVRGNITEDAGATIAPGTSAVGTLTATNSVTLSGTTIMKIDAGAANNDKVNAVQTITYGGTLTVTAIDGTPTGGQTFKLFSAASYGGAFAVTNLPALSGSLFWNTTNLNVNGTISVGSTGPTTNANILSARLVGTSIVLHGTNNNGGQNFRYAVLTSTNLKAALSSWTVLTTNPFNQDGTFDYTNGINPAARQLFYDVEVVP